MNNSNDYEALYTKTFQKTLAKHHDKTKRIERCIEKILKNPKHDSHLLKKTKGIDLRGKHRRHLTGNFVIVYMICDECIENGFRDKGYNNCSNCDGTPRRRVIFLAFDKHEDIYSKKWKYD